MTVESMDPSLASKLEFSWEIIELKPRKVTFQMSFNMPEIISMYS